MRKDGSFVDHQLKTLIEELGIAINEALGASKQIPDIIAAIEREGYDVSVGLNATAVLQNREPGVSAAPRHTGGRLNLRFSSEDVEFLKSMHISAKP
jgi:hypothetical protein